MLGSLITLPLRVGVRSVEVALQASQAVAERAIGLVGQVVAPTAKAPAMSGRQSRAQDTPPDSSGPLQGENGSRRGPTDPRSTASPASETVAREDRAPAVREPVEAAPAPPAPDRTEPDHVSEEAVVVEEVAEPGAEDGAGAQIHIAEPWDGYGEMKAPDLVDRIQGMDSAQLAAVELYELSHRKRQTVLEAVTRELRRTQNPRQ